MIDTALNSINNEKLFELTFLKAPIGIALVAPDGSWLKVNPKICELVGYTQAELLALTFQDITHPEDLNKDLAQLTACLEGNIDHYQMEKRYIKKDGKEIWILLSVSLVRDEMNKPLFFISQIVDIDKAKTLQLELEKMNKIMVSRELQYADLKDRANS